jgi:hypothetical protein
MQATGAETIRTETQVRVTQLMLSEGAGDGINGVLQGTAYGRLVAV